MKTIKFIIYYIKPVLDFGSFEVVLDVPSKINRYDYVLDWWKKSSECKELGDNYVTSIMYFSDTLNKYCRLIGTYEKSHKNGY